MFDETKAREFYVDFLGFKVDWEHRFEPGTPLYMQLSQDHAFCTCRNTTATGVLVLRSG